MYSLSEIIKEKGISKYYNLEDLGAIAPVVPKDEAIEIINFLRDDFCSIINITVYKYKDNKFSLYYAWLNLEKEENENPYAFLQRSCNESIKYIQDLSERNPNDYQLFEITYQTMPV